jgi:ribokinase|tara:strand:+ start:591 stop:1637 length:1047 start_codon:yes stop_codon:yes gene_type:complete
LSTNKLESIFSNVKSTTLADVFIDRIVKIPNLDSLIKQAKEKSTIGGGSIRGIKQEEIAGGNATNIAYSLAKFGSHVNLFVIGDEFTKNILELRFKKFNNVSINLIYGKPGFTIALETEYEKNVNIMISDVGGIENFEGEYIINNYKETLNQSDVIIISNWASNTKGNELVKNIFSTAKNSIKLLDFADLSTSTNRLSELIEHLKDNKIVDMISLNENECRILTKFLGLEKISSNYTIEEIKKAASEISNTLEIIIDIHTPLGSCSSQNNEIQFVDSFKVQPKILTGAGDIWNAVNILAFKKKFSAYNRLNIANAAAASYISEYNRGDFPLTKVEELLESRGINTDSL